MVDMALVHGLERAISIVNVMVEKNKKDMKHYEEEYNRFTVDHPNDIFYDSIKQRYSKMYLDSFEENTVLEQVIHSINKEIDKEMSVDDDHDLEEVV